MYVYETETEAYRRDDAADFSRSPGCNTRWDIKPKLEVE